MIVHILPLLRSGTWMRGGGGVGPGCNILSTQSAEWQIPCSVFMVSFCSNSEISACGKTEPMQFICRFTVLCSIPPRAIAHTGGVHLYTATRTGLHYSPVSRDDSVPHLHFWRSSALQRNIRSLTCIDYCFYFHLKSNRLMFFGEKYGIKCDLMLNSWANWWLARKPINACHALNRLNASANSSEWCLFSLISSSDQNPCENGPVGWQQKTTTVTQGNLLFSWNSFYSYLNFFFSKNMGQNAI